MTAAQFSQNLQQIDERFDALLDDLIASVRDEITRVETEIAASDWGDGECDES